MGLPAVEGDAVFEFLSAQERKGLLRFLTCGSVDDGKSTLIGRLLYDTKLIFEDQLSALERDSRKHGTQADDVDLALLVDGLEAEREQGITIDVAYRFFTTNKRKFIVADTPGHEQYTRNMATGASNSDLAVILIDARNGILPQTRRHSFIASLLGIRHVLLAVNKIDLVDFSRERFKEIEAEYRAFAAQLGFASLTAVPISARDGDNVVEKSSRTPWYKGPSLLAHLESVDVDEDLHAKPFRLPVQWVNRPSADFRGFAGTIAGGSVRVGDQIVVATSGKSSKLARIVTADGDLKEAGTGDAVTLVLDDEIDISRGDLLCGALNRPDVSDQIAAHLIWMAEDRLVTGRDYLLKCGSAKTTATVTDLRYKIDVNSFDHIASSSLELNEIGFCDLSLATRIAFDPYAESRGTGAFILVDRLTNATVAGGTIAYGLRRATNVHWHALQVDKQGRAALKAQKPCVVWFTGLSGSGKSTIADLVEKKLHSLSRHTFLLDGDNVRHGLNKDLGFSDADRVENIRRIGETAKLFTDAGLIVLASFISPFRSDRQMARNLVEVGEFVEVFVDTPLTVCEERDPKGLYKKARAGEIKHFTGIDSPYEPPMAPELRLDTASAGPEDLAEQVVRYLIEKGYLG